MQEPCSDPCPPSCDDVFERVFVDRLAVGRTRVRWTLSPRFVAPRPYAFRLQYCPVASPNDADWINVGAAVTDIFCATDPELRRTGPRRDWFYRVSLTADGLTYRSKPTNSMGILSKPDLLIVREIVRRFRLEAKYAFRRGRLLKRRTSGTPCPTCTDIQTGEPMQNNCPDCFDTGYKCGYYHPIACVYADVDPVPKSIDVGEIGTTESQITKAKMCLTDNPTERDLWICEKTAERYEIHRIKPISSWGGVDAIGEVDMFRIPESSILHTIWTNADEIDC